MKKTRKETSVTLIAFVVTILIVFIAATFVLLNKANTNAAYRERFRGINTGWTLVSPDGESTEISTLPVKITNGPSEISVLKRVLPLTIKEYDAIAIRNYHQLLHVRIGQDILFAYPNLGWNGVGNIISDEWLIINLDSSYAGETIELHFTNSSIFKTTFEAGNFYYGTDNDLIQHIRSITFMPFMIALVVCIIGAFLLIISWIYRGPTNQNPNNAMGAALLCFGIWMLNRSKMPLFPVVSSALYFFSLIALMGVAPFIFLYAYYRNPEHRNITYRGYQISIVMIVFLILSCIVIRYNANIMPMLSYAMSCVAIVINGVLLYKSAFGAKSSLRTRTELMLDRTEFMANMIFPVAAVFGSIAVNNTLWTEVSMFFRSAALIYSLLYMVFVIWRTYLTATETIAVTKKLQESQLRLMIDQIQPHFLFNTLSAIRILIKVQPDVAYDAMYDFSKYLRANIDNVNNIEGIDFSSEVSHIISYINIEKIRFGDRINAEFDIQCDDFFVPPLSIQSLVENALQYGILPKLDGGNIWVRSYETADYDVIEVEDDGVGFNQETASHLFSIYASDDDKVGMESNNVMLAAMTEIMENLKLKDASGNPILLNAPIKNTDLTEEHQASKTMNVFLRLREMSDAKFEIISEEGKGTLIRIMIPVN